MDHNTPIFCSSITVKMEQFEGEIALWIYEKVSEQIIWEINYQLTKFKFANWTNEK